MGRVAVGDSAPYFALPSHQGGVFDLHQALQTGPLIVFFYPSDNTPICGSEICAFRDHVTDFQSVPCRIVGISSDSVETHRRFAELKHVAFPLLSDHDGAVRKAYGATYLWVFPSRTTIIIGADGYVTHRFDSQLNATAHVQFCIQALCK